MTSRGLLDTSIFIAQESGRKVDTSLLPDEVAISVVTLGELQHGVLTATNTSDRALRLATYRFALDLLPIDVNVAIANIWATLCADKKARKNASMNDLWIAATAIHEGVPLVTQDQSLSALPGLHVVLV